MTSSVVWRTGIREYALEGPVLVDDGHARDAVLGHGLQRLAHRLAAGMESRRDGVTAIFLRERHCFRRRFLRERLGHRPAAVTSADRLCTPSGSVPTVCSLQASADCVFARRQTSPGQRRPTRQAHARWTGGLRRAAGQDWWCAPPGGRTMHNLNINETAIGRGKRCVSRRDGLPMIWPSMAQFKLLRSSPVEATYSPPPLLNPPLLNPPLLSWS